MGKDFWTVYTGIRCPEGWNRTKLGSLLGIRAAEWIRETYPTIIIHLCDGFHHGYEFGEIATKLLLRELVAERARAEIEALQTRPSTDQHYLAKFESYEKQFSVEELRTV